jgi:hypothetical protein
MVAITVFPQPEDGQIGKTPVQRDVFRLEVAMIVKDRFPCGGFMVKSGRALAGKEEILADEWFQIYSPSGFRDLVPKISGKIRIKHGFGT